MAADASTPDAAPTRRALCTRLAGLAGLAALAPGALAPSSAREARAATAESADELVRRAERYFDGIESLRSRFVQINPDGSSVEGLIRLQRPGRMRIEYAPEAGMEVVADGTFFILVDHKLENTTYLPLESTPAHLLLREDFRIGRDIEVAGIDRNAGLVRLELRRADAPGAGSVTVTLNANPMQLRQWVIRDAQGKRTRVTLLDPRFGVEFPPELFEFDDPYGRRGRNRDGGGR